MEKAEAQTDSARGRVREVLVTGLGFRFPKGVSEDLGRKRLDRICDDLVYLSPESLRRLVGALRTKGEGSSRCCWPERATFLAFAELVQPRALEDAPGVASWFASAAGQSAVEGDRLVAEFLFWQRHKRPPLTPGDRMSIEEHARELRSRRRRACFNRSGGRGAVLDDAAWLPWFEGVHARALALVEAGRQGAAA